MSDIENTKEKIAIYLGEEVKETFKKFSLKTLCEHKEYGGILLGRVSEDGSIFVEIATHPNNFDVSSYLSFIRKKSPSQLIINRLWKRSKGTINYLGEWHTHPFRSNKPSSGDLQMIKESLEFNQLMFEFMIMIIADISGEFSITFANSDQIITKEDCNIEKLFYKF